MPTLSERKAALIAAMYANGSRIGTAGQWLDWATFEPDLYGAIVGLFKRIPPKQKLGTWFSEHNRQTFGELVLLGKYSGHAKRWIWRATSAMQLKTLADAAARAAQPVAAQLHTPPPEPPPLAPVVPAVVEAHAPSKPEQYEFDTRLTDDGRTVRTLQIDPRNGEPVRVKPTAPEAPAPPAEVQPEQQPNDSRPPWLQRGESKPRDKAEWLAWQNRRTGGVYCGERVHGWADPSGVVSQAIFQELAAGAGVLVTGPWPKM